MAENEVTRVPLTKATRELLKKVGCKAETYDEIMRRLVKEAGYKNQKS